MGKLQGNSSFFKAGPPAQPGAAFSPIVKFLLKEVRGTQVIDLGGGMGAYALELQKAGFLTKVVDVDASALEVAHANGLDVQHISPSEVLDEKAADTVILIEVLEHVEDPMAFLQMAIRCARKRVIFTAPCTQDFQELFDLGISYGHIPVTDHLHHFSDQDMVKLLEVATGTYKLTHGDPLFPHASFEIIKRSIRWPIAGWLSLLPLRILNRLGGLKKRFPARYYGVIDV